jgi:hypothetical protein
VKHEVFLFPRSHGAISVKGLLGANPDEAGSALALPEPLPEQNNELLELHPIGHEWIVGYTLATFRLAPDPEVSFVIVPRGPLWLKVGYSIAKFHRYADPMLFDVIGVQAEHLFYVVNRVGVLSLEVDVHHANLLSPGDSFLHHQVQHNA